MQAAIETHGLRRRFGKHAAVDGIELLVPGGSIFGFLGPNGAGKTTTIRLLLGLIRPSGGTIQVLGQPMPQARRAISARVGALVEAPAHYDQLTATENLEITRRLLGLERREIGRVLEIVGLTHAAGQRVRGFSLGMRQRLGIARALLGRPRLLILDEPTNGLDPDGIRDMRALLRALPEQEQCTVFLSSHLLAEVEQVASHVGLMWRGRLITQGPLDQVLDSTDRMIEIEVDRAGEAERLLRAGGFGIGAASAGRIELRGDPDPARVNALLVGQGIGVSHLARKRRSLEGLYVDLTGNRDAARQGAS